jgi:chromosomal replication initiation ATPase DnaA
MSYFQPPSTTYMALPSIKSELGGKAIESIVQEVAELFGIQSPLIYEKVRYPNVKYARWFIWKILRSRGNSLKEVGRLGNFDHTTVVNAMSKIDHDIEHHPGLKEKWEKVKHYCGDYNTETTYVHPKSTVRKIER